MKFGIYLFLIAAFLPVQDAKPQNYANTEIVNSLVEQNRFLNREALRSSPPKFNAIQNILPEPYWPKRPDVIKCYWKAWQLAFSNIHGVTKENGFIMPYIDPAFNGHIFMWDTTFMLMFGRYGCRAFDFQSSLDNLYHRQHKDGYICREISAENGDEIFEKFDPSSTGPNIMPWAEWEYYLTFKDTDRLKAVFPVLLAYYQWFHANRSWPDGSYFSTGWGCGMDNQPRVPPGFSKEFSHAFMSWTDTTLQQIFAGKLLMEMAAQLKLQHTVTEVRTEVEVLTAYVQQHMWNKNIAFFFDRFRGGRLSDVKSIAAYWALLAGVVPDGQLNNFIRHLENPREFARLHRVPTLSADHPEFKADGKYWQGGVWAPTSYMVLRGLTKYKQDSLAFEIAYNHLDNVVKVFNETGTLWENYAPDFVKGMYRKDMVGWTGLVPISVLFEYVFGIRPDTKRNGLIWDIRLLDEYGIKKYPFMKNGMIDLQCKKRKRLSDRPDVKVRSNVAFDLTLSWKGGSELLHIRPTKR